MCGRYYIDIAKDELSFVNNFSEIEYEQNFNVAPQNQAPCIIDNNLVIANWGYFPDWLKSQSILDHYLIQGMSHYLRKKHLLQHLKTQDV